MRRRPTTKLLAAACVTAGLATVAPPALAAAPQLEQINRATGTAGAFGLTAGRLPSKIGPITNDGRYAFFGVGTPFPGSAPGLVQDANPGLGLWVRDVVRNTTTKLTSDGDATFGGIDRTQRIVSFITSEGLAGGADTNGKPDLYAYDPVTGLKLLISRSGLAGRAVGLTSYGAITRGSTVAVYGTAQGVIRRELLTGRTTKVANGSFIAPLPGPNDYSVIQLPADQYVSNDGRSFVTPDGIVTPWGVRELPIAEYSGEPTQPFVNEAGTILTWQGGGVDLSHLRQQNARTGVITTPEIPEAAANAYGSLQRPTPDGKGLILTLITFTPEAPFFIQATNRWDLTRGTLTPLGPLVFLSRNDKYGFTGARSGASLVGGTTGNTLPGTIDLPAATAYVTFFDRCEYVGEPDGVVRKLIIAPELNVELPAATTARFRASAGAGKPVVVDRTVAVPTQDGFDPSLLVDLPFADGAFRLDLTITLADGRTITSRVDHAARTAPDGC